LKKVLFFFIFAVEVFAFDSATASKIFTKIFYAMLKTEEITVYSTNEAYQKVILDAPDLYLCTLAKRSDIILVSALEELPENLEDKVVFSTSYLVYQTNENVVGVFYWDHGHIKIEFSKKRLKNKNISLPSSFDKYIKDDE